MSDHRETYLGDGLYASFDGWHIWLRAPREDGDHKVALEPATFAALLRFVDGLDAPQVLKVPQQDAKTLLDSLADGPSGRIRPADERY